MSRRAHNLIRVRKVLAGEGSLGEAALLGVDRSSEQDGSRENERSDGRHF